MAKRRQAAIETQGRIGGQGRGTSVVGDGEDVFFAAGAEGFDRLGSDRVDCRARCERELEGGEG